MYSAVQVQRDESEFARLSNLGDVLGLTPMDINAVHTGLAEQAFRHQVQMVRCKPLASILSLHNKPFLLNTQWRLSFRPILRG